MEIVGLLPFVLAGVGFVIGSIVAATMRASVALRLIAAAGVFVAAIVGAGLVLVGLVRPAAGLLAALLIPVLTSIGLRHLLAGKSP